MAYDIADYAAPTMVYCNRCNQMFASYDMYFDHRFAADMGAKEDYTMYEPNETVDISGFTVGYQNCDAAQEE